MIDNYDSFTFNLVHYFEALGQEVRVFRNDEITVQEIEQLSPSYIVISPGPGKPSDAGISLDVIAYFSGKIPLLGVCLGHQCIAQHFGAKVVKANKVMHGKTSMVTHIASGLFHQLKSSLQVTRYHSLVVEPTSLPAQLVATAWVCNTTNNKNEIMALQHQTDAIYSVQFHPESVLTSQGMKVLDNFIQLYK